MSTQPIRTIHNRPSIGADGPTTQTVSGFRPLSREPKSDNDTHRQFTYVLPASAERVPSFVAMLLAPRRLAQADKENLARALRPLLLDFVEDICLKTESPHDAEAIDDDTWRVLQEQLDAAHPSRREEVRVRAFWTPTSVTFTIKHGDGGFGSEPMSPRVQTGDAIRLLSAVDAILCNDSGTEVLVVKRLSPLDDATPG